MNDRNENGFDENQLRELIESVLNGDASDEQNERLEKLLLENEHARDVYLNYANLHANLGRWFLASDFSEPTTEPVANLPVQNKHGRRIGSTVRIAVTLCLVTLLLLVAGSFLLNGSRNAANLHGPMVVQFVGEVQIQNAAGATEKALVSHRLQPGDSLQTASDEDRAVLRYDDGTKITLLGSSSLLVQNAPGKGKKLELKSGLLLADVARQPAGLPLLIRTPHTQVRVLGTKFELAAHQQHGTRLDLETGRVELVRGEERPLQVEPNSIAVVPTTPEPIRVSPRPATVRSPIRETSFRGLKSVDFAKGDNTLVAATRWQAVYWFEDDRLEAIPVSPQGKKGVNFKRQHGSLLAFHMNQPNRLATWNSELRKSQTTFKDFTGLTRQFKKASKHQPGWKPPINVATMDPQGGWVAFQVGRSFRIWNVQTKKWSDFTRQYDGKFLSALTASPDGKRLAVAVRRGEMDVLDVQTGHKLASSSIRHEVPFAMKFSADGNRLVVGFAGRVRVYEANELKVVAEIEQPGLPFLKVAISHNGSSIAAASLGERIQRWDVATQKPLSTFEIGGHIQDLTFSPDGQQLAVVSRGGRLSVWNTADSPKAAR